MEKDYTSNLFCFVYMTLHSGSSSSSSYYTNGNDDKAVLTESNYNDNSQVNNSSKDNSKNSYSNSEKAYLSLSMSKKIDNNMIISNNINYDNEKRILSLSLNHNGNNYNSNSNNEKFILVISPPMNKSFARRLNKLHFDSVDIQYKLACLSTLGGAYHLCNHPDTALLIAIKQEIIAKKLGSTSAIVRSKVFQAVNLGLLGKIKESAVMFQYCFDLCNMEQWTEMRGFVEASRKWLEIELAQQNIRKKCITNGSNSSSNGSSNGSNNYNSSNSNNYDNSSYINNSNIIFPTNKAVEELQ